MFKKLISSLPYNPGLLDEFNSFLTKQRKLRDLWSAVILMMSLSVALLLLSILLSPGPSLRSSSNDLVFGATTKNDILIAYDDNRDAAGNSDIQKIYSHFGITRENIQRSVETKVNSSSFSSKDRIARNPATNKSSDNLAIEGSELYILSADDIRNNTTALRGTSSFGEAFYILLNGSGSVVMRDVRTASPSTSLKTQLLKNIDVIKTSITSKDLVKPGEELVFTLKATNPTDLLIVDPSISININDLLEYSVISELGGGIVNEESRTISWTSKSALAPGEAIKKSFKARILDPLPTISASASDPSSYDSEISVQFGSVASAKLERPIVKKVGTTTAGMMSPSNRTALIIVFALASTSAVMYFDVRTKAIELVIAKHVVQGAEDA